jgi:hypothetical protein
MDLYLNKELKKLILKLWIVAFIKQKAHEAISLGRFTNPLEGTALVTDVKTLRETMLLGHP